MFPSTSRVVGPLAAERPKSAQSSSVTQMTPTSGQGSGTCLGNPPNVARQQEYRPADLQTYAMGTCVGNPPTIARQQVGGRSSGPRRNKKKGRRGEEITNNARLQRRLSLQVMSLFARELFSVHISLINIITLMIDCLNIIMAMLRLTHVTHELWQRW